MLFRVPLHKYYVQNQVPTKYYKVPTIENIIITTTFTIQIIIAKNARNLQKHNVIRYNYLK